MKLDRKFTAALAFAVFIETTGGLLWAGAAAERLSVLEAEIARARPVSERLARVEGELVAIRASLVRIERKLEAPSD